MKNAPQLPRFKAPKNMTSKVFLNKKDKMKSRQNLKKLVSRDLYL